jgi:hypothetical protein
MSHHSKGKKNEGLWNTLYQLLCSLQEWHNDVTNDLSVETFDRNIQGVPK